jgi:membrane-bound serine protease (ClpP class)
MVVPDLEGLLRQLDGRSVERFDGRKSTLALADAEIERVPMSWRQRFLGALAHPQIAYLLLTLGMLGLTVEIWNPGSILPGVAGGLCLLLAFFAFQIVPISTAGVLLVLFGVALVVLELKVPSFGALGIGGVISLLIGGIMMTRTVPGVSVSLGLIVPMAILTAALVLFLGRLALVAQRQPAVTGREGLIGAVGRTRTPISPDAPGQIDLRGEIWNAVSREPIAAGRPVRVRGNEGLTLQVEPIDDSRHKGDEVWKD